MSKIILKLDNWLYNAGLLGLFNILKGAEEKSLEVKETELEEKKKLPEDYAIYIPINHLSDSIDFKTIKQRSSGTIYKLAENYTLENYGTERSPKYLRKWNKVEVVYSSKITALDGEVFLLDEEENIVMPV